MKEHIDQEIHNLNWKDGHYEFNGKLPDSRRVQISVSISHAKYCETSGSYWANTDVEVWCLDNDYQLTDEEVDFWTSGEFGQWYIDAIAGGCDND